MPALPEPSRLRPGLGGKTGWGGEAEPASCGWGLVSPPRKDGERTGTARLPQDPPSEGCPPELVPRCRSRVSPWGLALCQGLEGRGHLGASKSFYGAGGQVCRRT